jgi:hypothetical protein
MPINTFNFAGIEPIGLPSGVGSLFSDILKTSKMKHETTIKGEEAKYAPKKYEYENIIKGTEAKHAPKMAQLAEFLKQNEANFAPLKSQADIGLTNAQAYHHGQSGRFAGGGLTEIQRNIGSVFPPGSPEYNAALRDALGIPENNPKMNGAESNPEMQIWNENSFPLTNLPKQAQTEAIRDNKKYLDTGIAMTDALHSVNTAQKLLSQHGDLNGTFEAYLLNPDSSRGLSLMDFAKSRGVKEKDRTAIQKMSKAYNDIVLGMSAATGQDRQRVTDSMRELIISTKPQIGNTNEANKFILNNLAEKLSEGPELSKAARWATSRRRGLQRNPGAFKPQQPQNEPQDQMGNFSQKLSAPNGQIMGTLNGERLTVSPANIEAFKAAGGIINE